MKFKNILSRNSIPMENQILFYEREFYVFSNFSSFSVEMFGIKWQTSEHLYQAMKFKDIEQDIYEEIKNSSSAHDSKKIAEKYSEKARKDWPEVKVSIMEKIVRAKHSQHPYIQKKLLQTIGKEIIEDSPKDSFWGWGPDKTGKNQLGKIWMKIRDEEVERK